MTRIEARWLALPNIPLALLGLAHFGWVVANPSSFGSPVYLLGILIMSAYPGIWVLAVHQLSEQIERRYFKPEPAS